MVDIEEETPDLINQEIDFGDRAKEDEKKNEENEQEIMSNILKSDIPVDEWKREVERVSSKLKIDFNNFNLLNTEWRGHLENLSQDIDRSLEKISKKESLISKNFINIVI